MMHCLQVNLSHTQHTEDMCDHNNIFSTKFTGPITANLVLGYFWNCIYRNNPAKINIQLKQFMKDFFNACHLIAIVLLCDTFTYTFFWMGFINIVPSSESDWRCLTSRSGITYQMSFKDQVVTGPTSRLKVKRVTHHCTRSTSHQVESFYFLYFLCKRWHCSESYPINEICWQFLKSVVNTQEGVHIEYVCLAVCWSLVSLIWLRPAGMLLRKWFKSLSL